MQVIPYDRAFAIIDPNIMIKNIYGVREKRQCFKEYYESEREGV